MPLAIIARDSVRVLQRTTESAVNNSRSPLVSSMAARADKADVPLAMSSSVSGAGFRSSVEFNTLNGQHARTEFPYPVVARDSVPGSGGARLQFVPDFDPVLHR